MTVPHPVPCKPTGRALTRQRTLGSKDHKRIIGCLESLTRENVSYLDFIQKDTLLEKIIHVVLEGRGPWEEASPAFHQIIQEVRQFSTVKVRTVVFGGGAGLSSILGGDPSAHYWTRTPFFGLKRSFPSTSVVVCTTDDGGSSGKILRSLPCIALGDIRRAALSCITPRNLLAEYPSLGPDGLESLAGCLEKMINYRCGPTSPPDPLRDPLALIGKQDREGIPRDLVSYLSGLGSFFRRHPLLRTMPIEDHCLGNLWLVAAIYRQIARHRRESDHPIRHPAHTQIVKGIHEFARKIGAGHRSLYPATTTQGELQFLYAHGVISSGEHKSSLRHSSFPVERLWVNFIGPPQVDPLLIREIEQADLIILAPGSLYSSIIPIFQVPALTDAVRSNRHALKILGASFWAQHGETDISSHRQGKEYYVSELIEAYHNNIPGGIEGLLHQVVVTDVQAIPGDILRNYALEGKVPIYLDKKRVAEWGVEPIEAAVFSEDRLRSDKVIQHDPEKFAQVIRTLCVLRNYLAGPSPPPYPPPIELRPTAPLRPQKGYLSEYADKAERRIAAMDIRHPGLRDLLKDVIWDNREILFEHLLYFQGILVIPARSWARSTEWDNILGYFDPDDGYIKLHARLLNSPEIRRVEDILIAMGESLLGNYVLWKRVRPLSEERESVGKVFEIHLQKPRRRRSFLNDGEIREYLRLAQLCPSAENQDLFRMAINDNEAFTPPGLLFGLLYAWYLNNTLGGVVEYEMSLMRWKISQLIPKQSMERARKQRLIEFFRARVFRQQIP